MENARVVKKRKIMSSSKTASFIEVWRGKIKELRGARKNGHILLVMEKELKDNHGIILSVQKIRTRINNLTKRLRNEKQIIGKSGGSPSDWEYFNEINEFIEDFKSNRQEELVVESIDETYSSLDFDIYSQDMPSSSYHEVLAGSSKAVGNSTADDASPTISPSTSKSTSRPSSTRGRSSTPIRPKNRREAMNEQLLKLAKEESQNFKDFMDQSKKNDERNELLRENIELQKNLFSKNN